MPPGGTDRDRGEQGEDERPRLHIPIMGTCRRGLSAKLLTMGIGEIPLFLQEARGMDSIIIVI